MAKKQPKGHLTEKNLSREYLSPQGALSPEQGTVRLGQFYHGTNQVFSPAGVEKEEEKHSPAGRVGYFGLPKV